MDPDTYNSYERYGTNTDKNSAAISIRCRRHVTGITKGYVAWPAAGLFHFPGTPVVHAGMTSGHSQGTDHR